MNLIGIFLALYIVMFGGAVSCNIRRFSNYSECKCFLILNGHVSCTKF